jgi:ribosomal protein S6--L-glutamate ligase
VVIKKVSSRQGQGTFLAADLQAAREWFQEERQRTGILVQRFIDPAGRQDLRVLVMGARAAAAVSLQPAAGDFRANFHLTGSVRPMEIDPRLASLAVKATAALGLQIAGVDLMVDGRGQSVVVEANYSPGFQGLEAATGADIAGQMIDFAASVVREGKEKHRP